MDYAECIFMGVDPGAIAGRTHRSFTYAVLDGERQVIALERAALQDVVSYATNVGHAWVAINGPSQLNHGLLEKQLRLSNNIPTKSTPMRLVEFELQSSGLRIPHTPDSLEKCPHWMITCLQLYHQLMQNNYIPYPSGENTHQLLETQAEALFAAWNGGHKLLPASSLEGRIQRQLILLEQKLPLWDPMGFFEEITRFKLIRGILPVDRLHLQQELNALASAQLAWQACHQPDTIRSTGRPEEGILFLNL